MAPSLKYLLGFLPRRVSEVGPPVLRQPYERSRMPVNPVGKVIAVFQSAYDYVFVDEKTGRSITVTLCTKALQRFRRHDVSPNQLASFVAQWVIERPEWGDAVDLTCEETLTALYEHYRASKDRDTQTMPTCSLP